MTTQAQQAQLSQLPQRTWDDGQTRDDVAAVRAAAPLVHCLTNYVAAPLTANVLLAAGAIPAMVATIEEAGTFAAVAGAVLLNVGTITTETANTFLRAAEAASRAGTPWVLDPVAVGAGLRLRDRVATDLLEFRPAIIRGNGSEILGLSGAAGGGKGPDSTATSEDALDAAAGLARSTGAVVAISGEVDLITDGTTTLAVPGGHPVMTKVTGVGCSLGALIAAYAAVVGDPLRAAASASALLATAGSRAAATSTATGSFAVALLNELSTLGA
jgi:hydroxyethylthiazole kinase